MEEKALQILLIEDNPADASLVEDLLADDHAGNFRFPAFKVTNLRRLSLGIEHIKKEAKIDLILLDLHLPDSNGLDTFLTLFQEAPHLPIVVMTGLDDEQIGSIAVDQGAEDYLDKSADFETNVLKHAIYYAIDRHKYRQRLEQYYKILEDNQKALKVLIEQNPSPMVVVTDQQKICFANPSFVAFKELPLTAIIGSTFDTAGLSQNQPCELKISSASGEKRIFDVTHSAIQWESQPAKLLILHDVTEHSLRENALKAIVESRHAASKVD